MYNMVMDKAKREKQVCVRLSEKVKEELTEYASKEGRTIQELIREAIAQWLARKRQEKC